MTAGQVWLCGVEAHVVWCFFFALRWLKLDCVKQTYFASVGADCEEDDGGDEDGVNVDPSPLRKLYIKQREKTAPAPLFVQ